MSRWKMAVGSAFAFMVVVGATVGPASADAGTHRVFEPILHDGYPSTPSATDSGWYRQDTRVGGGVTLTNDFGSPDGPNGGSLALTTNDQNSAKAQLNTNDDVLGISLGLVSNIGYSTWHSSAMSGFSDADASYQLRVDLDGDLSTTGDQTNLVYEPYYNDVEGPSPQHPEGIVPDAWQSWDATGGNWWSSKQIGNPAADPMVPSTRDPNCGFFHIEPGAGGPPFTQPSAVAANCASARVVQIGVNAGSFNPNYIVAVDDLHLNIGAANYNWDFGPGAK